MRIYMAVTPDEFELPIALSDTQRGLAKMLGSDAGAVCRNHKAKRHAKYKVIALEVEDEED